MVLKLSSSRLRKSNWNLNVDLCDAIRNGEIVSLADSQCIRFIDSINGVDSNALYEEVQRIRHDIRALSRDDEGTGSAGEIRGLYKKLNSLLFIPEYLLLVIEKESDYIRACEGFYLNGRHYKRFLSTAGGVKLSTIIFVSDTGKNDVLMRETLVAKVENGRDQNAKMVPAKLESYRSLVCSASTPVSSPNGVLVVPDCVTHFKSDYILLSDNPKDGGEPIYTEVKDGDVEIDASDGFGLITPELCEVWSAELGLTETASGFCCRNAWTKGMLIPMDFREFASEVAHKSIVNDIWGTPRNVFEVDIILTESMLKLWSSYDSWEQYEKNCQSNGFEWCVTKVAEATHKESRDCNYEFIQVFDLSDADIERLIAPTMDDISGVMGGDPDKANLFMRGLEQTESSVQRFADDYVKAAAIDNTVLNDPFVRGKISSSIRRRCDRAKLGRVRVRGDYQVVSGDMYALCQSVFGLPVTGLLNAGEIYTKYWVDRGVDEVLAFRAPMSNMNNVKKVAVSSTDEVKHWYRYAKGVVVINAWDMMMPALNGMD